MKNVRKEEVRLEEQTEINVTNKEKSKDEEIANVSEISKKTVTEEMDNDCVSEKSNTEQEYYWFCESACGICF